jgi:hypothetical protein
VLKFKNKFGSLSVNLINNSLTQISVSCIRLLFIKLKYFTNTVGWHFIKLKFYEVVVIFCVLEGLKGNSAVFVYCLLGYNAMSTGRLATFRKTLLFPSLGSEY